MYISRYARTKDVYLQICIFKNVYLLIYIFKQIDFFQLYTGLGKNPWLQLDSQRNFSADSFCKSWNWDFSDFGQFWSILVSFSEIFIIETTPHATPHHPTCQFCQTIYKDPSGGKMDVCLILPNDLQRSFWRNKHRVLSNFAKRSSRSFWRKQNDWLSNFDSHTSP